MSTEPEIKQTNLKLTVIEGFGPAKAKKLKDAGIEDIMQLAVLSSDQLSTLVGGDKDDAALIISKAQEALRQQNLLRASFMTGWEEYQRRKGIKRCSTGSKYLDELLGGGIETENITEFFGEPASGKTQIAHTAAVMATQPIENGGLGGSVIWIDTEGTYHPERIEEIASGRGFDAEDILKNKMITARSYNSAHLELLINELPNLIKQYGAKLIVVDSIINQHRGEFGGMGMLADRQQRLNAMIHTLERIATIYKVAVIWTNQVMAAPATFAGDPTRPTGGNVVGHASGTRVYLRNAGKVGKKAKLVDSARLPPGEAIYMIAKEGIIDNEEEYQTFVRAREKMKEKAEQSESLIEGETE
jgi:DNA repair protein RadA